MARIDADAQGRILRYAASAGEEALFPPLGGAAATLSFDEHSNDALAADLSRSTDPYRLVDGVLTKSGAPVTVNPPPAEKVEREAAAADLRDQYAAAVTALDAIINGATTLPDDKTLARTVKRMLRLLRAQVG